ncbi:hypothetical protein GVAV_001356 [Gurleya vavrai]
MHKREIFLLRYCIVSFLVFLAIVRTSTTKENDYKTIYESKYKKLKYHQNETEENNFKNYENNCYVNSIIQALFTQKPFVKLINETNVSQPVINELKNIFYFITDKEQAKSFNTYSIATILNKKQNINFRREKQEDAHEFLQSLLQEIFNEFEKGQINDELLNFNKIFNGIVHKLLNTESHSSNIIVLRDEIYNINYNVTNSILSYLVKPFYIEENTNKLIKPVIKIEKQPLCLIISIQRGAKDKKERQPLIIEKTIYLPEIIDSNYANNDYNGYYKYCLNAVIVHKGYSVFSGHYIAYCKRKAYWYCFDDLNEDVVHIENEKAFDEILKGIEKDAYILFYEETY